jgi:hypothetical protein
MSAAAQAPAANATSTALRTFWTTTSKATTAHEVIAKHAKAQQADRAMRWSVRRDYRESGLVSNLYPVMIDPSRAIYRYELEVVRSRREPPAAAAAGADGGAQGPAAAAAAMTALPPPPPVSPTRAWRMYAQQLRATKSLPPVLRVGANVFSAAPLPEEALTLQPQFHDVGWERCGLRLTDHAPLSRLSASDLKQVINKALPWSLSCYSRRNNNVFSVVREVDGKMICTDDSIAVSGLRIFRGTTAAVLQIAMPDGGTLRGLIGGGGARAGAGAGAAASDGRAAIEGGIATPAVAVPETTGLRNLTDSPATHVPLRVLVHSHVRTFDYKEKKVSVVLVQDASGTATLTMWDNAPGNAIVVVGAQLDIANYKIKAANPRFATRTTDIAFELHGGPHTTVRAVVVAAPAAVAEPAVVAAATTTTTATALTTGGVSAAVHLPVFTSADLVAAGNASALTTATTTTLALRLDTRCTVAAERSLLDEVRQHFGSTWPYTEEQQKRIARAVQGTPVILAPNLQHTVVRAVRFDYATPEDAPLDPHLRRMSGELQKQQVYAVVHDFSVVPLQLLHTAFDPKMRSWQQVTAPACSFFPDDRVKILDKFRAALVDGLAEWGVTLVPHAFSSRNVTVMDKPAEGKPFKSGAPPQFGNNNGKPQFVHPGGAGGAAAATSLDKPRLVSITAIRGKHTTPEELQTHEKTASSLARHFATPHQATVDGEAAALEHVRKSLMTPSVASAAAAGGGGGPVVVNNEQLRDPSSVAVFLSSDRDTRAARWLTAECMRRGILPYFMAGVSSDKRLRLLNVQTSQNLRLKFGTNPFPGLDFSRDVPSIRGRNVLLVGIDTCHTNATTTGSCVGFLVSPRGAFSVPTFWQNEVRGQELEQVTRHFGVVVEEARRKAPDQELHEVIVYQDGNVYAELEAMERCVPAGARLSFMCLHKRTHIRFTFHDQAQRKDANVCKGSVVRALTPVSTAVEGGVPACFGAASAAAADLQSQQQAATLAAATAAGASSSSFFLQCHECFTSTARTVQFMVHRQSETLPLPDLQKLTFALAHVGSPQSTKLPLPTRAAHRLSAQVERLVDASPAFRHVSIPEPLRNRCWFL